MFCPVVFACVFPFGRLIWERDLVFSNVVICIQVSIDHLARLWALMNGPVALHHELTAGTFHHLLCAHRLHASTEPKTAQSVEWRLSCEFAPLDGFTCKACSVGGFEG